MFFLLALVSFHCYSLGLQLANCDYITKEIMRFSPSKEPDFLVGIAIDLVMGFFRVFSFLKFYLPG
jgi:hypothetical protein